jgi:hypothetical protein
MANVQSNSGVHQEIKHMSLSAVVHRADGTTEDLGTVAEYHNDPEAQAKAIAKGFGIILLCA